MNCNAFPAIILIYLVIMLPLPMEAKGRRRQTTDFTTPSTPTDLYALFNNQLNASATLAQNEYDKKTMYTMDQIYEEVGKNLINQLQQQLLAHRKQSSENLKPVPFDITSPLIAAGYNGHDNAQLENDIHKNNNHLTDLDALENEFNKEKDAEKPLFLPLRLKKLYSQLQAEKRRNLRAGRSCVSLQNELSSSTRENESTELHRPRRKRRRRKHRRNCLFDMRKNVNKDSQVMPQDTWLQELPIYSGHLEQLPVEAEDVNNLRVNLNEGKKKHVYPRDADSFPDIYTKPLNDPSVVSNLESNSNLNAALRNANTFLAQDPNMPNVANVLTTDTSGVTIHRYGKDIEPPPPPLNPPQIVQNNGNLDSNVTTILEKVLRELENIKECQNEDNIMPEGSPCDILGAWNSEVIGLQFHISTDQSTQSYRPLIEGKQLEIEVKERIPSRQHPFLDCSWFITGTAVKLLGGPFYMTAQKPDKYLVATFAGLCKNCGNIPMIFGSWTFVYPAKDCHDITLAIENKRDVLRKDSLQIKRKHRREKCKKGSCKNRT